MTYKEFKEKLKECGLTIREFAKITKLNEKSISVNWGKFNKVPNWVDVFLDYYKKDKIIKEFKEKLNKL